MFGGKGMRGGSGGNIIRTASRAVARASVSGGAALQDPFPSPRPSSPTSSSRATRRHGSSNYHGLSSSSPHSHCPVSATCGVAAGWPFCNRYCDELERVAEDENENGNAIGRFCEDVVGWSVPSLDEVQGAVSALHQVFGEEKDDPGRVGKYTGVVQRNSPVGSEVDWVEPCLELGLGARGAERVYAAFHLLQTDPSVLRMVVSVSSDKAVWNAILDNETVQYLRKSFSEAEDEVPQNPEEGSTDKPSEERANAVRWIFDKTKTRVMEVMERIAELVNQWFENGSEGDKERRAEGRDPFEERLRTSFFISIVVLLLVMVSRANKASP